jgi:hypothetical protein
MIAAAIERLAADWVDMMDAAVSREGDLGLTLGQAVAAWEATITAPNRPIAVFAWATLLMAESSEQSRDALIRVRDRTSSMVTESLILHLSDQVATQLAGLVIDAVVSSALQYELDRDRQGLRARLEGLVGLVGASAGLRQG